MGLKWLSHRTYADFTRRLPMSPLRLTKMRSGYAQEYPSPTDLMVFMAAFRSDGVDAKYSVELVNGGSYDPGLPGVEGNLNMQFRRLLLSLLVISTTAMAAGCIGSSPADGQPPTTCHSCGPTTCSTKIMSGRRSPLRVVSKRKSSR